jgi:hypothetical protein
VEWSPRAAGDRGEGPPAWAGARRTFEVAGVQRHFADVGLHLHVPDLQLARAGGSPIGPRAWHARTRASADLAREAAQDVAPPSAGGEARRHSQYALHELRATVREAACAVGQLCAGTHRRLRVYAALALCEHRGALVLTRRCVGGAAQHACSTTSLVEHRAEHAAPKGLRGARSQRPDT